MTSQSSRVFLCNRTRDVTSVTHTRTDRTNIKVLMYYIHPYIIQPTYPGVGLARVQPVDSTLLEAVESPLFQQHVGTDVGNRRVLLTEGRMNQIYSVPHKCQYLASHAGENELIFDS